MFKQEYKYVWDDADFVYKNPPERLKKASEGYGWSPFTRKAIRK